MESYRTNNPLRSALCIFMVMIVAIDTLTINTTIIFYSICFAIGGILYYMERRYYGTRKVYASSCYRS